MLKKMYNPRWLENFHWSNFNKFENCGRAILWGKGWEGYDLGGGVGKSKPFPVQQSEHWAIPGRILATVTEMFYNESWYKDPSTLYEKMEELIFKEVEFEYSDSYIDKKMAPSRYQVTNEIIEDAKNFVEPAKCKTAIADYAAEQGLLNPRIDYLDTMNEGSILQLDEIDRLVNLCRFAYLAIKYPSLVPLVKLLIKLPPNRLFKIVFDLCSAPPMKSNLNLSWINLLRWGIKLRQIT